MFIGNRVATAVGARALAATRSTELKEAFDNSDKVVAVCKWLYDALLANGVPENKLLLSRQGVWESSVIAAPNLVGARGLHNPLQLLFLGRWDRVKGIDLVVRALKALPSDLPIRFTVHAVAQGGEGLAYEREVRALAASDTRIVFADALKRDRVLQALLQHDVLVVPSQWLETGPLVVAEALAAGTFVLGSRLGGIAELVTEGENGELVPHADVSAWAAAIARLVEKLPKRTCRPAPVRTMANVAQDMIDLYQTLHD